jgi:hypothetical protein
MSPIVASQYRGQQLRAESRFSGLLPRKSMREVARILKSDNRIVKVDFVGSVSDVDHRRRNTFCDPSFRLRSLIVR